MVTGFRDSPQRRTTLEGVQISLEKVWMGHWTAEKLAGLTRLELVWSCLTNHRLPSRGQKGSRHQHQCRGTCSESLGSG